MAADQSMDALKASIKALRERGERYRREASELRTSSANPAEKTERLKELKQKAVQEMNALQAEVDARHAEAHQAAEAAVEQLTPQVDPVTRQRADARLKELLDSRLAPLEIAHDAKRRGDLALLEGLKEHLGDLEARGTRTDRMQEHVDQVKLGLLQPEQATANRRLNALDQAWPEVQRALQDEVQNVDTANAITTSLAMRSAGLKF